MTDLPASIKRKCCLGPRHTSFISKNTEDTSNSMETLSINHSTSGITNILPPSCESHYPTRNKENTKVLAEEPTKKRNDTPACLPPPQSRVSLSTPNLHGTISARSPNTIRKLQESIFAPSNFSEKSTYTSMLKTSSSSRPIENYRNNAHAGSSRKMHSVPSSSGTSSQKYESQTKEVPFSQPEFGSDKVTESEYEEVFYRDFSHITPEDVEREIIENPDFSRTHAKKEPIFPQKLHVILANPDFERYIVWLPHGRAWKIIEQKKLEKNVLPIFFEHQNFSSFMRQVNNWGFKRISDGQDEKAYYHELFLRGLPHISLKMRRLPQRKVQKKTQSLLSKFHFTPNFYKINETHPLPNTVESTCTQERKEKCEVSPELQDGTEASDCCKGNTKNECTTLEHKASADDIITNEIIPPPLSTALHQHNLVSSNHADLSSLRATNILPLARQEISPNSLCSLLGQPTRESIGIFPSQGLPLGDIFRPGLMRENAGENALNLHQYCTIPLPITSGTTSLLSRMMNNSPATLPLLGQTNANGLSTNLNGTGPLLGASNVVRNSFLRTFASLPDVYCAQIAKMIVSQSRNCVKLVNDNGSQAQQR